MTMPSRHLGDPLATDWAQAALLFPQIDQPLFPFQGVYHLHVETFFVVAFPQRVIWIRLSTDFRVPVDWHVCGGCEIMHVLFYRSEEHPVVSCDGFEVFLRNPFIGLLWVFPLHPSSHCSIDLVIYCVEGFFAYYMLVIVGPSPNDGVQLDNQMTCRRLFVGLDERPYLLSECRNVLS